MTVLGSGELLACRDLCCGYVDRTVLRDVSLTLQPGGITALLGPNGSGKSTLLKTVSKMIPTLGGDVLVGGRSVSKMSFRELARKVAFVPQEEHVPFRFRVFEVVLMGRMPHSSGLLDSQTDLEAAERAIEEAGCGDLRDRPITELSGGEKQRVLVARALAQEAPVLLLDEPTSHMDIGHQVAMVRLVHKLADSGYAILAAVHDLNLAALLARDAILIKDGAVAMSAPCDEVLEDPRLDDVYGVQFKRIRLDDGRLRLFPA
jgi:iron complex transport system ATP-binding protein